MKLFTPNEYIKDFRSVDCVKLKNNNIKLIICDIDNTLVAHDESHPSEDVKKFIKLVKENGLEFCLISNNVNERVSTFSKDLNVKTYSNARKPLKLTYKKIMNDFNLQACDIASIGDQLLTDVLGGNRVGIYTILTHPLYTKDLIWTKFNRSIENQVFKHLEKKGLLVKGDYHE